MNNDTISLLIPTRARPGLLACTVRMLMHLAAKPERVEILLYVDDDDPVDYAGVWSKFAARGVPSVRGQIHKGPRRGYTALNECFNLLAEKSSGRWLGLWNDDIFMATKDWDLVFDGVPGDFAVAVTESNHGRAPCTFPFLTREVYRAMGHISLNTHSDTWVEEVGRSAEIAVEVPVLVLHAMIDDALAVEGKARIDESSASFYSAEMKAARAKDVKEISIARMKGDN